MSVDRLRNFISDRPRLDAAFASCPMVHMIRFMVIDDVQTDPGTRTRRVLPYSYLMIAAELDGHHQDFCDHLFVTQPDLVLSLFRECVDFDPGWVVCGSGFAERVYFRRFIARCTVPSWLPYFAVEESARQIRDALARQDEFTKLVIENQSSSDAKWLDAWKDFSRRHPELEFIVKSASPGDSG